jgi:hypothetical protein
MTKAEAQGLGWLIVVGLPLFGLYKLGESIGWVWFGVGIVLLLAGYIWHKSSAEKARQEELARQEADRIRRVEERRSELLAKYGEEKIVDAIMRQSYWQGQTAEQLRDSLGNPADIDEKVLKTKKKEVWKYRHLGGNRFGLRITLEHEQVVGWDEKL